jgi:hypothetical protein
LLQLHGFAACADREVRDPARARDARRWDTVADTAGLDPVTVESFLAFGMPLSNVAAPDVDELDEPWAKGSALLSVWGYSSTSPPTPTDEIGRPKSV